MNNKCKKTLLMLIIMTIITNLLGVGGINAVAVDRAGLNGSDYVESVSVSKKQIMSNEEIQFEVRLKDPTDVSNVKIEYRVNDKDIRIITLKDYDYDGIFDDTEKFYRCVDIETWKPIKLSIEYRNKDTIEIYNNNVVQDNNKYYYDLNHIQFEVMDYDTIKNMAESLLFKVDIDKGETIEQGYDVIRKAFSDANISYIITGEKLDLVKNAKINIVNQEKNKYKYSVNMDKSNNTLSGSYNIKSDMANGHYDIEDIEITLINGYKIKIDRDYDTDFFNRIENADIYIVNYDIDINTLSVTPASVIVDNFINIKASALDYPEKKEQTILVGYTLDYGYMQEGKSVELKLKGNVYEGSLYIDKNVKLGTYKPEGITALVFDNRYNYYIPLDDIENNGSFTVTNKLDDLIAPELKDISINSQTIKTGEELIVQANAVDEKSGVDRIEVDYGDFIVVLKNDGNKFTGRYYLSHYRELKKYTAKSISVYDKAGNVSENNSNFFDKVSFDLIKNPITSGSGQLKALEINKNKFTKGENIEFTAAFDGIPEWGNVKVTIENAEFGTTWDVYLMNRGDKFIGSIPVDTNMNNGQWYIKSIVYGSGGSNYIFDKRYEQYVLNPIYDLSHCYFTINNNDTDTFFIESGIIKTTLENKVINGDVYVKSYNDLSITFKGDIEINGNLYITGNLYNKGNLKVKGSIYAKEIVTREPGVNEQGLLINKGGKVTEGKYVLGNKMLPYKMKLNNVKDNTVFKSDNPEDIIRIDGKITAGYLVDIMNGSNGITQFGDFYIEPHVNNYSDTVEYIDLRITDPWENTTVKKIKVVHSKFNINNDDTFDLLDLASISTKYNKTQNMQGYDIKLDFNKDGIIDLLDLVKLSINF